MNQFVLTCCSTADMTESFFQTRNIPYVCFHVLIGDKTYADDLGKSISFPDFYDAIRKGNMPTTSQVNVEQFTTFFEPILAEGNDILHISLSSGLSGSFNSAHVAREALLKKYPDRRIELVDSLGASSGYGMLVTMVADQRDNGASIDEARDYAESIKLNLHHWFFSTDLTHYRRGGRITAASAVVGTLFNICPLLNMNDEGKLTPRTKYQGKNRVIHEIIERMVQHADNGLDYAGKCYISHSDCLADAEKVAQIIEEKFPKLDGKVLINYVGTVIGAHTGPGTVALYFMGDRREP